MNSFKSWFRGLRGKLLLTAALPAIALGLLAYVAVTEQFKIAGHLEEAYGNSVPTVKALGEMRNYQNKLLRYIWTVYILQNDIEGRKEFLAKAKTTLAHFEETQKDYERLPMDEDATRLYKVIRDNSSEFTKVTNEVFDLLEKNTPEGNDKAREMVVTKWRALANPMEKANEEIVELNDKQNEKQRKLAQETSVQVFHTICTIATAAGLILVFIMLFLATWISRTISGISSRLTSSSDNVSSSSVQLSSAGQQLSSASTEAAASLEETVSSLEELSSMVKLNADNAREAAKLSQSSRSSAEQGETEIKGLISSMTEISQSSKKIEDIINVIDDIAFQTNLLALNAAVEAARAGEQGKGFAVVAEAVRSLAQRSAAAAKDITSLIKDSVVKIEHGTKIADKSGGALKEIVDSVKKVSELNTEISSACQEQSTGIAQISQAMNQLDQATQNNASSAAEVASSSESMSSQSVALREVVSQLISMVDGAASGAVTGAPAPVNYAKVLPPLPMTKQSVSNAVNPENVIPLGTPDMLGKVGTTDGF